MVPLLDLKAANAPMQEAIEAALLRVARSGRYILGPEVEAFEAAWAAYCGTAHCVGTGNALEALQLVLMALGVGPGDEVIVPSNTYIATWLAVTHVGATPIPVEPDPQTFNIDPKRVENAITPRTRAIIAVHLYGRCADMGRLGDIASRYGLPLLEDAAQAHGARCGERLAGNLGLAAAFSFYPSKNLGALGDAGAITTNDAVLATKCARLRNYGGVGRLDHHYVGLNSRLDEMQAAVLLAKLPHLDAMNEARRLRAIIYDHRLRGLGVIRPDIVDGHDFHQYVLRAPERRDMLMRALAAEGIEAHIHYPEPPHWEGAYAHLGIPRAALPIASQLSGEVLSLPIGNDLTAETVEAVVRASARVYEKQEMAA